MDIMGGTQERLSPGHRMLKIELLKVVSILRTFIGGEVSQDVTLP
jgi:hypothetical protein